MANLKKFVMDGDDREWHRTFHYGALERGPYAEQNLWVVSFSIYGRPFGSGVEHTFVVTSDLATTYYMNKVGPDVDWWLNHSVHHWVGPWNAQYEMLWAETPVHEHVLRTGDRLYYGVSFTKHPLNDSKYLMYVALGPIGQDEYGNREYNHVFLVDDECCQPGYMDRMGGTSERWQSVCWDHPATGHDPRTHSWWVDPDWKPNINHWFRS